MCRPAGTFPFVSLYLRAGCICVDLRCANKRERRDILECNLRAEPRHGGCLKDNSSHEEKHQDSKGSNLGSEGSACSAVA